MLLCCEALLVGLLGCMGGSAMWLPCPCRGAKLYTARMPSPACMQICSLWQSCPQTSPSRCAHAVSQSILNRKQLCRLGLHCHLRRGWHHAAVEGVLARLQVDELRLSGS